MAKPSFIDDLYDRWSDHAYERYCKLMRQFGTEPLGAIDDMDPYTKRSVLRFMKGLHKGIYPRGKAWQRVDINY